MKGTHETLTDKVNKRLHFARDTYGTPMYQIVNKEAEFWHKGNTLMEIDNYAIRCLRDKTYVLLFEDKSSDNNREKAVFQLNREEKYIDFILDRHYLPKNNVKVFKFYVYDYSTPKYIMINREFEKYNIIMATLDKLQELRYADKWEYLNLSISFQDEFSKDLKTLKHDHQKEILKKFVEVYYRDK